MYRFAYQVTVDADAVDRVGNQVVAGGGDVPVCETCATEHAVQRARVRVTKTSDPDSGVTVVAEQLVRYRIAVLISNTATTAPVTLTDTLEGEQTLLPGSLVTPSGGSCTVNGNALACMLASGSVPGIYRFEYQAEVAPTAIGRIGNRVVAGGGGGNRDPECIDCTTEHPIAGALVTIGKRSLPPRGTVVARGDVIEYTLVARVERAATSAPVELTDTPGPGLEIESIPAGCVAQGAGLVCTLPVASAPGVYSYTYRARVGADAGNTVSNSVTPGGGGGLTPECGQCDIELVVEDEPAELHLSKSVGARQVKIGDLVRYTLVVENTGSGDADGYTVVDTPPPGFSYVEGSFSVADRDNAGTVAGQSPLRFAGIDIAAGGQATLVYVARVGAGVRPGVHVNRAQVQDTGGKPASNEATAQVELAADPLLDESLVLGTVFDDRDGDGWQDAAGLTGLRVQGGFDAGAYLPGSTSIDRGSGAQPLADASAPLLRGLDLGALPGRQSEADPAERRQIVIRQRLREPAFTGDFVLSSDQGLRLRMDAAGNTTVERSGEAARGLTAVAPEVERRIAQAGDGVEIDYVIRNAGIDERGLPGVRIASVEGLLVETDQYGRYHLVGIHGGGERGRNFILKVDPSTLPAGATFTTDNPLLRRITPGLPVRFDFGVRLPQGVWDGGSRQIELVLGEVLFAPGRARIEATHAAAIGQMAQRIAAHRGGDLLIAANGDAGLALARAEAVKAALLAELPDDVAGRLAIEVREDLDDAGSGVAGVGADGLLLGTLLFDTDRAEIKPVYAPLLDQVARGLWQADGGTVRITGHTDVRGSHDYNTALGLRRARAVYEAIAERLPPELRARVRVEVAGAPSRERAP